MALEAHLSTKPETASENAWIPRAHEDPGRPQRFEAPAPEGPPSPASLRVRLASQQFLKIYRLRRRSEFRRVYEEGQRRSAAVGTVFIRPNGLPRSRLGITAPTRLGNAVLRNRLKRRVREFFRLNCSSFPGGWDIIVNPRETAAEIPFQALERELRRLFPTRPAPAPAKEPQ